MITSNNVGKAFNKICYWDFPGGPVVEKSAFQCRGCGLNPGQGTKIPRAMGQLLSN